jgi:hypothetical protein
VVRRVGDTSAAADPAGGSSPYRGEARRRRGDARLGGRLGQPCGLVEMGVVEVHPWNATVDDIEHADRLVFDSWAGTPDEGRTDRQRPRRARQKSASRGCPLKEDQVTTGRRRAQVTVDELFAPGLTPRLPCGHEVLCDGLDDLLCDMEITSSIALPPLERPYDLIIQTCGTGRCGEDATGSNDTAATRLLKIVTTSRPA